MKIFIDAKPAALVLADGFVIKGLSFGATGTNVAMLKYNTQMVGYDEVISSEENADNIMVQTFPLIGNYGISEEIMERDTFSKGLIVREFCESPSNYRSKESLDELMKQKNIIGLFDIDTRALTKKLRNEGSMLGIITTDMDIIGDEKKIDSLFATKKGGRK